MSTKFRLNVKIPVARSGWWLERCLVPDLRQRGTPLLSVPIYSEHIKMSRWMKALYRRSRSSVNFSVGCRQKLRYRSDSISQHYRPIPITSFSNFWCGGLAPSSVHAKWISMSSALTFKTILGGVEPANLSKLRSTMHWSRQIHNDLIWFD